MQCQFCGGTAKLYPNSRAVYGGTDYGPIWLCPCGARVGCHKAGNYPHGTPLGTLADEKTRNARKRAHDAFDPIWRTGIKSSRQAAYSWLGRRMKLSWHLCHIGLFDVEQCRRVVEIVEEFHRSRAANVQPKVVATETVPETPNARH